MPDDMEFVDLRIGTYVEFGQSIYDPFGIAQLEPLSFGAICVVTNVCGCVGFVRKASGGMDPPTVIVADYTALEAGDTSVVALAQIGWAERDVIESVESKRMAQELFNRLPTTDAEREVLLRSGYDLASRMSWEVVVDDYLLPTLEAARRDA